MALAISGLLDAQEPHYARLPAMASAAGHAVDSFAIASDAELSVIAYREQSSGVVYATINDGRGLAADAAAGSGWSPPVAVSSNTNVLRRVQRDSVQVVAGQAIVTWIDDELGGSLSTVFLSRLVSGTWTTPVAVHAALGDVRNYAVVGKPGLNGAMNVHVTFAANNGLSDEILAVSSLDAGATFPILQTVSSAVGSGRQIGGVAIDSQAGEVYYAWTDDRSGRFDTWFRRSIQGFVGPFWLGNEVNLSVNPGGTDSLAAPALQVGGSPGWTGTPQRTVGVAYRRSDGDGTTSLRLAVSQDNGATFAPAAVVAHTNAANVTVAQFDLELVAGEIVALWQDNAEDNGAGGVTVPIPAVSQVWRAESANGVSWPIVQQLSAQEDPNATGSSVQIARLVGAADGTMAVFLEQNATGVEVKSAFADQANGTEWHDEYPQVSSAQGKGAQRAVTAATLAYNALYYNFLVGWLQELTPGSNTYRLMVGGYRPPEVEVVGWYQGSTEFHFEVGHLPFQDSYAFVLLSLAADHAPGGNLLLPDGRKTGIQFDAFTGFGFDNFFYFVGPNDPANEGVVTPTLPFAIPALLPLGLELCYVATSWGPYGNLHVVTDFQRSALTAAP
jgi:hypothetical protein